MALTLGVAVSPLLTATRGANSGVGDAGDAGGGAAGLAAGEVLPAEMVPEGAGAAAGGGASPLATTVPGDPARLLNTDCRVTMPGVVSAGCGAPAAIGSAEAGPGAGTGAAGVGTAATGADAGAGARDGDLISRLGWAICIYT